ncbi:hypothetical protein ESA_01211 [Cronobacter sakazakii ATCC BAA-894]|uniref:Uncharacterized protein n=1 Tax=Cronobacter sakazakii (strain ATCC BAA-894) TaxID=290339 RepID=A7MJN2_CROS8|nr:hypothetical protein ESA_01211 [Cronobacter sakazakii ATCC BAA-894]
MHDAVMLVETDFKRGERFIGTHADFPVNSLDETSLQAKRLKMRGAIF